MTRPDRAPSFGRSLFGRRHHAAPGEDRRGFGPTTLEVTSQHLLVDGHAIATFAICGYPREVHPGWLQPLLTYPGRLDVSVHVEPVDPVVAAARLKKQLGRLESGRRHGAEHGRLPDPDAEVATEDAYDLSARVARSEAKLFRVGLYLTVHADSEDALAGEIGAVRALAASLLLDAKPATWRSLQGWITCLPFGLDLLKQRRTFDTAALAAAFPFASADLRANRADPVNLAGSSAGVFYGHNLGSQSLVTWDRFALDNHNAVILGRSGAGKSYLVKLDTLRHLYQGVQAFVIDPEDEYARLAHAVDGSYVHLGAPGMRINPFDLPLYKGDDGGVNAPADALVRRSLFCQTVIAAMLGTDLSATQRAVLDAAIAATYRHAGITADPSTWARQAPLLADLAAQLRDSSHAEARELAAHLHPFTAGAYAGLFDGPTTSRANEHLVVYSLRDLPDELKPLGSLLVLDAVWTRVANPADRRPRLVVVDEAWLLMRDPAGARFLFRAAKALRKHWAGLTVATQDVADVLGTDLGKAIVSNAATQILLRQAPQAVDDIADAFDLSDGERQFLLAAERGCGLLSDGTRRAAFGATASQAEHDLITTNPAHLASVGTEPSAAVVDIDSGPERTVHDRPGTDNRPGEVDLDAA